MPNEVVTVTMHERHELNTIGGWLLVMVLLLVPHTVGAPLGLVLFDGPALGGTLGAATLLVTAVGGLSGILLAFSRHRFAPAFFTLYPPLLLALNLMQPDLLGLANARLAAVGVTEEFTPYHIALVLILNAALVVAIVAYWMKSERVQMVYGTNGLNALWELRRERF